MMSFLCASVQDLRQAFLQATNSEKVMETWYQQLENKSVRTPVEEAYLAAWEGLKAKYSILPFSKLSWVEKSQKRFRSAVEKDPLNYEIRFLRLAQEVNLPSFLGYNHQKEDTRILLNQLKLRKYKNSDWDHVQMVIRFLLEKVSLTESDKAWVKKFNA